MDYLKRATCKDFSTWDLNCPRIVSPDNNLRRKFKRKARRKMKQELQETFQEVLERVYKEEN